MPYLSKDVVEPAVIVAIFTTGALASRRTHTSKPDLESASPLRRTGTPSNLALDLVARFFIKFPFLEEIWYWLLTYFVYQILRAVTARLIVDNQPIFDLARHHALQILRAEHALGIDVELAFQQYVLDRHRYLVPAMASVYYAHITVGVTFLAYAYACCPRDAYVRVRRTLALDNAVAFAVLSAWRCCPPRLLPPEHGFVDVLHGGLGTSSDTAWTHNRFQLTIAAMPSLHFGTSLLLGWWLARHSPHGLVRVLAPLWPAAMLPTIVATGNHFVLDAAVGALIPCFGWRYCHVVGELAAVQDWVLAPLRRRMGFELDEEGGGKKMLD